MMIIPPTPEDIDRIVEMGMKDATSWAQEQGVAGAGQQPQQAAQHRSLRV